MPPAPLPTNEVDRIAALHSYQVLDTEREDAFDDIARLAARITKCPIALVSLVDTERQWFKSHIGIEASETHRDVAFCAHAILSPDQPLVVPDATQDPRFNDSMLVLDSPYVRAYLGVPLVDQDGFSLGTLCVIDQVPHDFDDDTIQNLRSVARTASTLLALRRTNFTVTAIATTDPLTGLHNRRAVTTALCSILPADKTVAAIAIDLDDFKHINDAEGHDCGDALLRIVAIRLKQEVRADDLVARIGGDEFLVLLRGMDDSDSIYAVADRLLTALNGQVVHKGRSLRLGASIGVAVAPGDENDPDRLLRLADTALGRAKKAGRAQVARASQADAEAISRRIAVSRGFSDAVNDDLIRGLTVHYQPIIDLQGSKTSRGRVISLEALTRWRHPELGVIPPSELFGALSPRTVALLGSAVSELAIRQAVDLRKHTDLRVAINLSAAEVAQPDTTLRIEEQAKAAGLPLSAIEIELTEEILLERISDRTLGQLADLRARGVRLALDDFGTGTSGLSQLMRLPFDVIKLDQRFIQQLPSHASAKAITIATVSLAHSLGMEVVAEGVETKEQLEAVNDLGCDAAQGFLLARPMSSDDLADWLEHQPFLPPSRITSIPIRLKRGGSPAIN